MDERISDNNYCVVHEVYLLLRKGNHQNNFKEVTFELLIFPIISIFIVSHLNHHPNSPNKLLI